MLNINAYLAQESYRVNWFQKSKKPKNLGQAI
jgi:hypothetical protein